VKDYLLQLGYYFNLTVIQTKGGNTNWILGIFWT